MPPETRRIVEIRERIRQMRRCAIYTRQSRNSQQVLASCEVQRQMCEVYARSRRGWILADERYDDAGHSSETLDRPALQRLLDDIEQERLNVVIVYRLDRLSRRLSDFARLMQTFHDRHVQLAVVTDPPAGGVAASGLFRNLAITFAEFEQSLARERMAESRAALKRRGRRVAGAVPYGYRADPRTKQLVIAPQESRRVRKIFEMAAGGTPTRDIAEMVNRRGWRLPQRRRGEKDRRRWTPRQVLQMLANPVYAGLIRDGRVTKLGVHEAIVTKDSFDLVRRNVASRRSRTPRRAKSTVPWPLRGLLKCGRCRRNLIPSVSGYRNIRYRYYRCRSHAGGRSPCRGVSLPAHEIEEFVRQRLSKIVVSGSRAEPNPPELSLSLVDDRPLVNGRLASEARRGHRRIFFGRRTETWMVGGW